MTFVVLLLHRKVKDLKFCFSKLVNTSSVFHSFCKNTTQLLGRTHNCHGYTYAIFRWFKYSMSGFSDMEVVRATM